MHFFSLTTIEPFRQFLIDSTIIIGLIENVMLLLLFDFCF